MKTRTERYRDAQNDPRRAQLLARCSDLDLGDGNLGEVVSLAIVDLGNAALDDLEEEVRDQLAPDCRACEGECVLHDVSPRRTCSYCAGTGKSVRS